MFPVDLSAKRAHAQVLVIQGRHKLGTLLMGSEEKVAMVLLQVTSKLSDLWVPGSTKQAELCQIGTDGSVRCNVVPSGVTNMVQEALSPGLAEDLCELGFLQVVAVGHHNLRQWAMFSRVLTNSEVDMLM